VGLAGEDCPKAGMERRTPVQTTRARKIMLPSTFGLWLRFDGC
jgi:hypothetical protein